jgi:hypothetical protein
MHEIRRMYIHDVRSMSASGHLQTVRLVVERGARLDLKDIIWQGTLAG